MTNGSLIKMAKGHLTRIFWLFDDGDCIEYTKEGTRELTCSFTTLYNLLKINGWKECQV